MPLIHERRFENGDWYFCDRNLMLVTTAISQGCGKVQAGMNKIVLDHYPVSKLPADMRFGLDQTATVRVVIEEETDDRRETAAETVATIRKFRESFAEKISLDEAAARIRDLRDEWEAE